MASSVARAMWALVVPRVMPVMRARASGFQWGGAQAGEGRNQNHALARGDARSQAFDLAALFDDAQAVAQPLHGRSGDEGAAFQGVGRFVAQLPGDGGQQAALAGDGFVAGVHEQEGARAVGAFGVAGGEAGLAEEGRLLVAGHAANRDAVGQDAQGLGVAVNLAIRGDARQDTARNAENLQQFLVPLQGVDVEEQGARGVGDIRDVRGAAG